MSASTLGRRERKRLATRDSIRAAALELFSERGFDAVSVEQVADAADVGASTVYRHFATKEALVLGRLAERQDELVAVLHELEGVSTLGELLAEATARWAPDDDEQAMLLHEIALAVLTPSLLERLQHQVVEWEVPVAACLAARCGRQAADLELRQLAALYCSSVRIVIREWAAGGGDGDLVSFGRDAIAALDHLPAAGLELLDR